MNEIQTPDLPVDLFDEFYEAVYGYRPFRWQSRLAAETCSGQWPRYIKLPTSSGKTACIDVAVFSLAHQAWRRASDKTPIDAPRRIFFVVDRRVIVNEAFRRASFLAEILGRSIDEEYLISRQSEQRWNELSDQQRAALYATAFWLRKLAANEQAPPLDCFELRGGIYRDDAWVRSILQPTVLTSTVDQLGSRILFRGYGVSDRNLPIHAALTANDSLIILDEAHCSRPFSQTIASVTRYRDADIGDDDQPRWAEERIRTPFQFVEMTATPRAAAGEVLELTNEDYEADPLLAQRHQCEKPITLIASKASGKDQNKKLAKDLAAEALKLATEANELPACRRIAIVVNRVACARAAYELLRAKHGDRVHLMIGRMRPIDRDKLTQQLQETFRSGSEQELDEPYFVVATQCLEVGADLDFDGMVTQCASLDALRQRFGRLNRLGKSPHARGSIVMAAGDEKPRQPDPIYGESLPETWKWLNEHATATPADDSGKQVDFGIRALEKLLADSGDTDRLSAPSPNAPVLMPAHVDMLCQTSPRPALEPDVAAYLHGPERGIPEVRICWRADLPSLSATDDLSKWAANCQQALAACPPSSAECLDVPLRIFVRWLMASDESDDTSDVLSEQSDTDESNDDATSQKTAKATEQIERAAQRFGVVWTAKGCEPFRGSASPRDLRRRIHPQATIVLPASAGGWGTLGHIPNAPLDPAQQVDSDQDRAQSDQRCKDISLIDVATEAYRLARARSILRVHPQLNTTAIERRILGPLLDFSADENMGWRTDFLQPVEEEEPVISITPEGKPSSQPEDNTTEPTPAHMDRVETIKETLARLRQVPRQVKAVRYPGGIALIGPREMTRKQLPREYFDDEQDEHNCDADDLVSLESHLADVASETERVSQEINLPPTLRKAVVAAAERHDLGKADPRFQAMLLDVPLEIAWMQPRLWAKSPRAGIAPVRSGNGQPGEEPPHHLPKGFRHEMLSLEFAQRIADDLNDSDRDVLLHVVAAHHGHARPFAPVVLDEQPPAVTLQRLGANDSDLCSLRIEPEERAKCVPPHRLDSGISERFWRLTRRFGWWGLAWLETTLRLADWTASAQPNKNARLQIALSARVLDVPPRTAEHEVICIGLDGANPLGFLAAVGLFRHVARALDQDCRMAWAISNGHFCPVLTSVAKELSSAETFLDWLFLSLQIDPSTHSLFRVNQVPEEKLTLQRPSAYSEAAEESTIYSREWADVLSCNGSDLCEPTDNSQLQTARRDYFVKSIVAVIKECTKEHLQRSLFQLWDYADPIERVSLHLEPREDRRHAYQWHKPTGDPTRKLRGGMVGANRLAMEAWPLFQSVAVNRELQTVGFRGTRPARGIRWTWPLWNVPIQIRDVTPLLNAAALHRLSQDENREIVHELSARGVSAAMQVRRILVEKTPNFTMPTALFTSQGSEPGRIQSVA
ncbi:MAG: hypothetical protein KatS3mg111_3799 [Pirellulaceae bacterium]|nr:MAG: hypothetical protein KatS3mg111_3799 [Pirellulaceae bacterium]